MENQMTEVFTNVNFNSWNYFNSLSMAGLNCVSLFVTMLHIDPIGTRSHDIGGFKKCHNIDDDDDFEHN